MKLQATIRQNQHQNQRWKLVISPAQIILRSSYQLLGLHKPGAQRATNTRCFFKIVKITQLCNLVLKVCHYNHHDAHDFLCVRHSSFNHLLSGIINPLKAFLSAFIHELEFYYNSRERYDCLKCYYSLVFRPIFTKLSGRVQGDLEGDLSGYQSSRSLRSEVKFHFLRVYGYEMHQYIK